MTALPLLHSKRTAIGVITDAYAAPDVIWSKPERKPSAAMKLGLKFEAAAYKHINRQVSHRCDYMRAQPHFRFELNGSTQSIFPDAIIGFPSHLVIVEFKLRHTYDGWNQLNNLYAPVLRKIYPGVRLKLLEVVKYYDPGVKLRTAHKLVLDLPLWLEDLRDEHYGVHILGRVK